MSESKIGMNLRLESEDICDICDRLESAVKSKLDCGIEKVNTEELGQAVDMIKDLYEAKEKLYKACYYKQLMEAMEGSESEPSRMYYPIVQGSNSGSAMQRGIEGGYDEVGTGGRMSSGEYQGRGTRRNTNRGSRPTRGNNDTGRYGFSFDDYMDTRDMYSGKEPEHKRMRTEALNSTLDELVEMSKEVVREMEPEEKQLWKSKISKLINM